jgi:hypothetical protein
VPRKRPARALAYGSGFFYHHHIHLERIPRIKGKGEPDLSNETQKVNSWGILPRANQPWARHFMNMGQLPGQFPTGETMSAIKFEARLLILSKLISTLCPPRRNEVTFHSGCLD